MEEIEVKLYETFRDGGTCSYKDKLNRLYYTFGKYDRVYNYHPFKGTAGLVKQADGYLPHLPYVDIIPVKLKIVEHF